MVIALLSHNLLVSLMEAKCVNVSEAVRTVRIGKWVSHLMHMNRVVVLTVRSNG
jgi:hypothetical protein